MKKDYQEFDIKLNMKTILLFEEMADKSFYDLNDEDLLLMVYCSLVVNNNQKLTYSRFKQVMENEKIAKTLLRKCQEEMDFMTQFEKKRQEKQNDNTSDEKVDKLTSIINLLILQHGLDINYVMNEMRLWEIAPLVKSIDEKSKADMVEKRFWAYLNICPHIDSKKIKGPEQLLPFPWEKETKKQDALKFMEDNRDAIRAFFNKSKSIKKDE